MAGRGANLPLKSPYEALIRLDHREGDRPRGRQGTVGSVFINRLRIGMRLQTDPTVIYGLGESFDGNLRRRDLTSDTPYNTYTRTGLPPTPIAMPGLASIQAALSPADTRYLYFVARGDGSSHFSQSLDEHNQAEPVPEGRQGSMSEAGVDSPTFEGIDGAGKSSQIAAVVEHLRGRGLRGAELRTRRDAARRKLRELLLHEAMNPRPKPR